MNRQSFNFIVDRIKGDNVFATTGKRSQRPVWYQLAVFLLKYGRHAAHRTAEKLPVAEGTVQLYCTRVVTALRRILSQHISWPVGSKLATLKAYMETKGFPSCIGMLDASVIRYANGPAIEGHKFFDKEYSYSVSILKKYITYLRPRF